MNGRYIACLAVGGALWGTVLRGLFGAAIGHDEWDEVRVIQGLRWPVTPLQSPA